MSDLNNKNIEKETNNTKNSYTSLIAIIIFFVFLALLISPGKSNKINEIPDIDTDNSQEEIVYNIDNVPPYTGQAYVYINNNNPEFEEQYLTTTSFEEYSNLDYLNRCGKAFANIGIDLMPTEERGNISSIKPSGWNQAKYDIISGKYLYNRCHLIGFQLTGESANAKNLITCTRQANTGAMLEFENKVAKYIKNTKNHVLYRVTPVFKGENKLASGIQIEAYSVEDNGNGISFNIYIYNVQDGIEINYLNGESKLIDLSSNQTNNKLQGKQNGWKNPFYFILKENKVRGKFYQLFSI